jgi:aspartate/methionine/tyrosine aminotransferase
MMPSIYELDQNRNGDHVIGVYTFSKLFCPGMRVGFNIGPQDVIEKMINIKEGSTLNSPKYNQDMCAAFFPPLPDSPFSRELTLSSTSDRMPFKTSILDWVI